MRKNVENSQNKSLLLRLTLGENGYEIKAVLRDNSHASDNYSWLQIDQPYANDETMMFNKNTVQHWLNQKIISLKTAKMLTDMFDDHEKAWNLAQKTDSKDEEGQKRLSDTVQKSNEKTPERIRAIRHLFAIKDTIDDAANDANHPISPLFKKHVDTKTCIGVTKAVMDRIAYIPELLDNAKLVKTSSGHFIIRAELPNEQSQVGAICLEHDLQTKNQDLARQEFNNFLDEISHGDFLKIWLAYWAEATEEGFFKYIAPLTDIMKHTIKNTTRYCSVNEKKHFWEISKLLEKTKVRITIKVDSEYVTINHPLLELPVTASKTMEQEIQKGYPDKVLARVLNPNIFKNAATLATEISRGTLTVRGDNTLLLISVQIRGAQCRDRDDKLLYDETKLMQLAGLVPTYIANPREARKRLKKKLDKAVESNSIRAWKKNKSKIVIDKRSSKKNAEK